MNKTMVNVALTSLMASDAALSAKMVIGPMVEEKLDSEGMTERKAFLLGAAEAAIEVAIGAVTGVVVWMYANRKK